MSNTTQPSLCEAKNAAIAASRNLALKLVQVEQDADLRSVFSIAIAHGYKPTSKFWQEALKAAGEAFQKLDEAEARKRQEDEAFAKALKDATDAREQEQAVNAAAKGELEVLEGGGK